MLSTNRPASSMGKTRIWFFNCRILKRSESGMNTLSIAWCFFAPTEISTGSSVSTLNPMRSRPSTLKTKKTTLSCAFLLKSYWICRRISTNSKIIPPRWRLSISKWISTIRKAGTKNLSENYIGNLLWSRRKINTESLKFTKTRLRWECISVTRPTSSSALSRRKIKQIKELCCSVYSLLKKTLGMKYSWPRRSRSVRSPILFII